MFDSLTGAGQLGLFQAGDATTDDLVTAVKGIYVTLADVDESGRTTPLLEAMRQSLDGRRESEEAAALADEIAAWLAARTQLRNGDLSRAGPPTTSPSSRTRSRTRAATTRRPCSSGLGCGLG